MKDVHNLTCTETVTQLFMMQFKAIIYPVDTLEGFRYSRRL